MVLEKVTVLQLGEESPAFLGTRMLRVLKLNVGFEDNVLLGCCALWFMI